MLQLAAIGAYHKLDYYRYALYYSKERGSAAQALAEYQKDVGHKDSSVNIEKRQLLKFNTRYEKEKRTSNQTATNTA
ncbi:MAG: hypothetical protein KatS3mg031_0589 [Chitinophagales bacterium]|nr:MAG: hypothetical protein KatS3mg031_0589 [Chitinophagales bacterium]